MWSILHTFPWNKGGCKGENKFSRDAVFVIHLKSEVEKTVAPFFFIFASKPYYARSLTLHKTRYCLLPTTEESFLNPKTTRWYYWQLVSAVNDTNFATSCLYVTVSVSIFYSFSLNDHLFPFLSIPSHKIIYYFILKFYFGERNL